MRDSRHPDPLEARALRRQSGLRNLLRRLSRDAVLADDLAQQTFFKAWRALPQLRSVGASGAWLRRLAVNTWLEHVRAAPPPAVATARVPRALKATGSFSGVPELPLPAG